MLTYGLVKQRGPYAQNYPSSYTPNSNDVTIVSPRYPYDPTVGDSSSVHKRSYWAARVVPDSANLQNPKSNLYAAKSGQKQMQLQVHLNALFGNTFGVSKETQTSGLPAPPPPPVPPQEEMDVDTPVKDEMDLDTPPASIPPQSPTTPQTPASIPPQSPQNTSPVMEPKEDLWKFIEDTYGMASGMTWTPGTSSEQEARQWFKDKFLEMSNYYNRFQDESAKERYRNIFETAYVGTTEDIKNEFLTTLAKDYKIAQGPKVLYRPSPEGPKATTPLAEQAQETASETVPPVVNLDNIPPELRAPYTRPKPPPIITYTDEEDYVRRKNFAEARINQLESYIRQFNNKLKNANKRLEKLDPASKEFQYTLEDSKNYEDSIKASIENLEKARNGLAALTAARAEEQRKKQQQPPKSKRRTKKYSYAAPGAWPSSSPEKSDPNDTTYSPSQERKSKGKGKGKKK